MEILITPFVNAHLLTGNASDFSCSHNERGNYAGKGSYSHAVKTTEEFSVVNAETRATLEEFFAEFGAWDMEEIQEWSDAELNGVCLQLIASDYKEWVYAQENDCEDGGRFYDASQTTDGEYYYYFGN